MSIDCRGKLSSRSPLYTNGGAKWIIFRLLSMLKCETMSASVISGSWSKELIDFIMTFQTFALQLVPGV